MIILLTILLYFCFLMLASRLRKTGASNDEFFRANRQSRWYLVAFGMIGASLSSTTFVSVPGMPLTQGMTYLQMCLGFIVGYFVVAYVLLPFYYRMNTTTIYEWLGKSFGSYTHKTGSLFFVISEMAAAAIGYYVVCQLITEQLQPMLPPALASSGTALLFPLVVLLMTLPVWLYTRRGGVKTLVWTDTVQTTCMLLALLLLIWQVITALGLTPWEAFKAVAHDDRSRIFVFDDWVSRQNFWKQFISGIFIVIVMTGLDQHSMHKNLTCRNLREAQKDMCTYGFAFVPVNALFMSLGILLLLLHQAQGTAVPDGDSLLMQFCLGGNNQLAAVLFTIGVVSASFSTVDSALTALTTTYCVDVAVRPDDQRLRRRAHLVICLLFALFVVMFRWLNSTSLIDAIYTICSYTYGPLLGIFIYGMFILPHSQRRVRDRLVPVIALLSPILCFLLDQLTQHTLGYSFGYELLVINALIAILGMWCTAERK